MSVFKVSHILFTIAAGIAVVVGLSWLFDFGTDIDEMPAPEYELLSQKLSIGSENLSLRVAEGYKISVAATDLGKARFISRSPDGRYFIPDMVDYNLSNKGKIMVLDGWNDAEKKFKNIHTYLSGLLAPNSVVFYKDDNGQAWIYIAVLEGIIRYKYFAGDTQPGSEPEEIFKFPSVISKNADNSVWHITRTLLLRDEKLYVSVGSGCNACEELSENNRAAIYEMDPDGGNASIFASGLRNAVGMEFARGQLYATLNGVDHLGSAAPNDAVLKIEKNQNYGWPYCVIVNGSVISDISRSWQFDFPCENVAEAYSILPSHSAPLGITYLEDTSDLLSNSFLVALHGSFNREIGHGYEIIRVDNEGNTKPFVSGFLNEDGELVGRPVHVFQKDELSLYFTDDLKGRLYYVYSES